jgi:hypothetical protein
VVNHANTNNTGTTNSTSYTATLGGSPGTNPAATATIGASGTALVTITGQVDPAANGTAFMGFAVSGATTQASTDSRALIREHGSSSGTGYMQASATFVVTGLNAGSNTFTLQYKSSTGTAQFLNRSIIVQPIP